MDERCFAMKRGQCDALSVKGCPGYAKCGFYKPRWKQRADLDGLCARLSRLPPEYQRYIAEKYYKGKMSWKKVR